MTRDNPLKFNWTIVKIKEAGLVAPNKGKKYYNIKLKADVGHEELLILEATDELDAWHEADNYMKKEFYD